MVQYPEPSEQFLAIEGRHRIALARQHDIAEVPARVISVLDGGVESADFRALDLACLSDHPIQDPATFSASAVKRMGPWDPFKCDPIIVTPSGPTRISDTRAADIKRTANERRKVDAVERHKDRVAAGDAASIDLQDIVDRYGYEIARGRGDMSGTTKIRAIVHMESVYKQHPLMLDRALQMNKELWWLMPYATNGTWLIALSLFARDGYVIAADGTWRLTQKQRDALMETAPLRAVRYGESKVTSVGGGSGTASSAFHSALYLRRRMAAKVRPVGDGLPADGVKTWAKSARELR